MPSRTRIAIGLAMVMSAATAYSQSLIDPRLIGGGPTPAGVQDSRGFGWNPAGLVLMRDWDFSTTTYRTVGAGDPGFVFHGLTLGKRFLEDEAVGVEYAPGTRLRLVVPPTLTLSGENLPVSNDREIEYQEPGSIGYAHRFSTSLSLGIAARYRMEEVRDTRISLVQRDSLLFYPVSVTQAYESNSWFIDGGLLWAPSESWTVGVTGWNLLRFTDSALPDSLSRFLLPRSVVLSLGIQYSPAAALRLAIGGTTAGTANVGAEWFPGAGFAVRGSLYADPSESVLCSAGGIGLAWKYESIEVAASYLRFFDRDRHSGVVALAEFDAGDIHSLDLNRFLRDRLALSVKASFGNVRDPLARIEQVQMYGAVYPSSFATFAYRPIGKARVQNTSGKPIQARVSFFVDRYMDAPTESPTVTLEPGASADVELTAVFNELVKTVAKAVIRDANIYVTATPAESYDDRAQARVVFRGKNEWDGNAQSLRFFVTPDDPSVLRTSRDILLQEHIALDKAAGDLEKFAKARILINGFAGKLAYVSDPKLSADYVQYPAETLSLRSGDCDDMAVCFSALLGSVGIGTAFVDVVPPGDPGKSHIFLLFDTGLDPRSGGGIAENPKRYVVRRGPDGKETVWIPIETTVIARGFDEAWTSGAQQYFDNVELGLGLVKGWVHVVDVK